jgi:hypothetical protein
MSRQWTSRYDLIYRSLIKGGVRALARTFARRAKFARLLCGEGKLELTESAREFQKVSAPQSRLTRSGGEEATGLTRPTYFFCGSSNFSPFLNTM